MPTQPFLSKTISIMFQFISDNIANIIGYMASICMVFGYLPQTVRTIRTRSTDDIAVGTFLLMGCGGVFFAIQGYLVHNMPLLLTNVLTTAMSAIIFGIKMYNDHFKKRAS
jgi:MtN3 and saliva related transmembrane protein